MGNRLAVANVKHGPDDFRARGGAQTVAPHQCRSELDRSEMVVFMEPAARTLLRLSCGCGCP